LCIAVASACGDDEPGLSDAVGSAIELLHCASLVHDDLPCFDDAATRRGKPSVHRAFGERLAVLAGDALIVLAFQTLSRVASDRPQRLGALLATLGGAAGLPFGIVSGQAWECEPSTELSDYHRAKTGALFVAATMGGAAAAGAESAAWRGLGERLGEAYQIADDICDAHADAAVLGKPTGRDALLGRPTAVRELGLDAAVAQFRLLVAAAADAIPDSRGAAELKTLVEAEARRILPAALSRRAA